jgi:hypothetical protein
MSEQFVGTMAVQERHRFNVDALDHYLRTHVEGYAYDRKVNSALKPRRLDGAL